MANLSLFDALVIAGLFGRHAFVSAHSLGAHGIIDEYQAGVACFVAHLFVTTEPPLSDAFV